MGPLLVAHKECLDEPGSWGQSDFIQMRSEAYKSPHNQHYIPQNILISDNVTWILHIGGLE